MIAIVAALALIQKAPPSPGDPLSAFTLQNSAGRPESWSPGKPTVVTFCAFWCDTWKTQTARLRTVRSSLGGLPVDMMGISVDGRWTEVGLQKAGMRFLSDPGGAWTASKGVNRVPYTFVVDGKGVVRWAASGIIRTNDVVNAVRESISSTAETGTVYLTFDDFPSLRGDDDILLDVLRKAGVNATFFCVGSRVESHAAVVRRTVAEGNELEVHAWNHDANDPEIDRCKRAIKGVTGVMPTLYRAPGHESIVGPGGELRFKVVDPYDYQRPGADEIARRVLTHLQPGSVIQLHSGVGDTIAALPQIIEQARKRGLTFAVLPNGK